MKPLIAFLLLSGSAFAQMPPPMLNQEPLPITIDVRMQEQIKILMADAPHKFAAPIINLIDSLQRDAQTRALATKAQPPK